MGKYCTWWAPLFPMRRISCWFPAPPAQAARSWRGSPTRRWKPKTAKISFTPANILAKTFFTIFNWSSEVMLRNLLHSNPFLLFEAKNSFNGAQRSVNPSHSPPSFGVGFPVLNEIWMKKFLKLNFPTVSRIPLQSWRAVWPSWTPRPRPPPLFGRGKGGRAGGTAL